MNRGDWLFVVMATVVLTGALLSNSRELFVYCILWLVVFKVALDLLIYAVVKRPRSQKVVKILESGDVDLFLSEIEKDIKAETNAVWRDMLLVNKVAGLYYKGAFPEGLQILSRINPKKFPRIFRMLFYVNQLAVLLAAERVREAEELIGRNPKIFRLPDKPGMLRSVMQANFAVLKYYQGHYDESRVLLEELVRAERPSIYKAGSFYFLGCIDLKQSRIDEGKKKLQEAVERAPGTFIALRAQQMLSSSG